MDTADLAAPHQGAAPTTKIISPVVDVEGAMAFTGLAKSTVFKRLAAGDFAPRVRLSKRKIGFLVTDLEAWLASKREQQAAG